MSRHTVSMKKHSRIILVCLLLGLMIGGVVAKLQPTAYLVNSTLLVTPLPTYGGSGGVTTTTTSTSLKMTSVTESITDTGEILTRAVMNFVFEKYPELKAHGLKPDELLVDVTDTNPTQNVATILLTATASKPATAVMIVNDVANGYVAYKNKRTQDELSRERFDLQTLYAHYQDQSTGLYNQILTYTNISDPHIALLTNERAGVIKSMQAVQAQLDQLPASASSDVSVIQPAKTTDAVLSTRPILYFALIAAAGLLIGLLIWLLVIFLDYRIQTDDQVPEKLGLSYLGTLSKDKELSPGSIPVKGLAAQQLADIGVNLRLTGVLPGPWRAPEGAILLITSVQPKDGKTTVATGLAAAAARAGRSVLVIDGNLRQPTTYLAFGLAPNGFGLSGLLKAAGGGNPEAAVQRTNNPGVMFLAGGTAIDDPTSLLEQRLPAVLAQLRKRADWIIIDGPALLGGAEAAILATMSDGVAVVAGREKVRLLLRAKAILSSLAHATSGIIMNRIALPKDNPYYAAVADTEDAAGKRLLAELANAKKRHDATAGQLASRR